MTWSLRLDSTVTHSLDDTSAVAQTEHLRGVCHRVRVEAKYVEGSHVCLQHCGECIANFAEKNGVIRPYASVELVRRPKQFIGSRHGHAGSVSQPPPCASETMRTTHRGVQARS